jgi:uncharacterized protein
MRKLLAINLFIFWAMACFAQAVPEKLLPKKPSNGAAIGYVVDDAGLLTSAEVFSLNQKLQEFDKKTSNQIIVVTVKNLHGYDPRDFATEIGHVWGVGGQRKMDNGVVFLISNGAEENGRRKVFIAPGYGLEGALPSVTIDEILKAEVIPQLKQNNYSEAINKGTTALIQATEGSYTAPTGYGKGGIPKPFIIAFVLFIAIIFLLGVANNGRRGGMASRRGYRTWDPPIFFPPSNSGGGGGFFDGGGGGGFGGFGGGDFGGSGAGGDW